MGYLACRYPSRFLLPLIYAIAVVPLSTSLSIYNLKSGVYIYDSIIISIILFVITKKTITLKKCDKILSCIIIFYLIYVSFAIAQQKDAVYILKDLRPFLYLLTGWLCSSYLDTNALKITNKQVAFLFVCMTIAALLKLNLQDFISTKSADDFYKDNTYRYLDASAYISAIFLIYTFSINRIYNKYIITAVCCSIIILAIANSRFMLLSIIITVLIANRNNIKKILPFILISGVMLAGFYYYSVTNEAERIMRGFTEEGIFYQIITRYGPALEVIENMDVINYFFGIGLGEPFYIPWFEYRGELNPYNINVDSLYFTLFPKFGLLSLLVIYRSSYFFEIKKNNFAKIASLFVALMFIVSATTYQIYSIGVIFGYILVICHERTTRKNN
ncbi:DUF6369 family protein [Alteromonas sp. 1_MG-2023]|uniref:DUF6369 family protein n=1 Tax=Alteromonas sp. 1_MG-2023 TaxID=3062669 RepID=UPI0026E37D3B|nr:DUF6369 family protein [Alteromonas sp. 1_MG-2023]MDO6475436.1 DUF6369 family protein [Alteromonas sp. 1_MG-2023]